MVAADIAVQYCWPPTEFTATWHLSVGHELALYSVHILSLHPLPIGLHLSVGHAEALKVLQAAVVCWTAAALVTCKV